MRLHCITIVALLVPISASAASINDYLLGLTPAGQAQYLTRHMDKACEGGHGAFYMGDEHPSANHSFSDWSIHCNEGPDYRVKLAVSGMGEAMDCRIYNHVYHGRCFMKLPGA